MNTYQKSDGLTSQEHVEQLRQLLPGAVLIPCPDGVKGPRISGWQKITFEETNDPNFAVSLRNESLLYKDEIAKGNIAVSLGKVSGGLCTIDFDSTEAAESFLKLNPDLSATLRTSRVRGENMWFKIVGPYPTSRPIKDRRNGKAVGEWRADGNCTMIYGSAMDTRKGETKPVAYRFVNRASPVEVDYDSIIWPSEIDGPLIEDTLKLINANSTNIEIPFVCSPVSLPSCITALLYNKTTTPADCLKLNQAVDLELKANQPHLQKLYERYIEPRFRGSPGARNQFVIEAAPFLCRTVGLSVSLNLMMLYYLANRRHFQATPNEHQRSCASALKGAIRTFVATLSEDEQAAYLALNDERERDAFRICRDMALYAANEDHERLTFFLSSDQLGMRLGLEAMQAWRVMARFVSCGIVDPVSKGKRFEHGQGKSQATVWGWLLPTLPGSMPSAVPIPKRNGETTVDRSVEEKAHPAPNIH